MNGPKSKIAEMGPREALEAIQLSSVIKRLVSRPSPHRNRFMTATNR